MRGLGSSWSQCPDCSFVRSKDFQQNCAVIVNVIVFRFKLTITNHQIPVYLRKRNSVHVSLMAFGF